MLTQPDQRNHVVFLLITYKPMTIAEALVYFDDPRPQSAVDTMSEEFSQIAS